jgi:alcohol dehydrogenase YqhD (iron-dependent ADH family)
MPVKCLKITNIRSRKWSEWVLLNANSAIFQLYHGEDKLIVNEMMMNSTLYYNNTLNRKMAANKYNYPNKNDKRTIRCYVTSNEEYYIYIPHDKITNKQLYR